MELTNAGYNWYFEDDTQIQYSKTAAGYRLYIFHTPTTLVLDGKTYQVDQHNVVFMERGEAHHIFSETGLYMLDWAEFTMDENDLGTLRSVGITLNEVFEVTDCTMISHMIMNICYMRELAQEKYAVTPTLLLMSIIYCSASLMIREQEYIRGKEENPAIVHLRAEIYTHPEWEWTQQLMAERTHYSVSRLQKIYRDIYGISCMEDVYLSRINHAKHLLGSSSLTVQEIAIQCGYRSTEHFSRSFKQRVGCSPKAFRETYFGIAED